MKIEIQFLSKIAIASNSIFSDREIFFFFWIVRLCFHLPSNFVYMSSRKKWVGIDIFSVSQSEIDYTLMAFATAQKIY